MLGSGGWGRRGSGDGRVGGSGGGRVGVCGSGKSSGRGGVVVEERCSGVSGGGGWCGEKRLLLSLAQAPADVCITTDCKNEDWGGDEGRGIFLQGGCGRMARHQTRCKCKAYNQEVRAGHTTEVPHQGQ